MLRQYYISLPELLIGTISEAILQCFMCITMYSRQSLYYTAPTNDSVCVIVESCQSHNAFRKLYAEWMSGTHCTCPQPH